MVERAGERSFPVSVLQGGEQSLQDGAGKDGQTPGAAGRHAESLAPRAGLLPPDLLQTKGVSAFQQLDTGSSLGRSHKASLLPEAVLLLGFFAVAVGVFYSRDQRAAVGAAGAKGGGWDPSSQQQGSPHKMWRFRAPSLANPSSSSVSTPAEGRAQTLSTAAPSRALRGPDERLDFY